MAPPVRVPGFVSQQFPEQSVATHLDYNPSKFPRKLDASADAQRVIDNLVNNDNGGIPERAAYDGGFRVGRDKHYHSHDVIDAMEKTAQYYTNLADRNALAGNTRLSQEQRAQAAAIGRAERTYAETVKNYWGDAKTTPSDVVKDADRGEELIARDGAPILGGNKVAGE